VTAREGERLLTIAFDAATGQELWRRDVRRERPMAMYKANDPASPTPTADADGVVAFFAEFGLVAYGADAFDSFFLRDGREEPEPNGDPRSGWGGDIFRYRSVGAARAFQFGVAEFLVKEYHVDGFRLDEFKGIDNYEFVQDFTDHAWAVHQATFPGRPFIVIAEDSWRRSAITGANGYRGRRVVDSVWDFDFRDDVRRLVSDTLWTKPGEDSRSARAHAAGDR
jgi:hypothetical protein